MSSHPKEAMEFQGSYCVVQTAWIVPVNMGWGLHHPPEGDEG